MRFTRILVLVLAIGGGIALPCHANVPNPANSFVAPCLIACPAGDITFQVVVRDAGNNPVVNATVILDFCDCPTAAICPSNPSQTYTVSTCRVFMITGASGEVLVPLQAGGGCLVGAVHVTADGIPLANRALASPDQDGSGNVAAADAALLDAKLAGAFDPTADLNCDGALGSADRAVFNLHSGHGFPIPTPARSRTWGELKTFYR